MVAEALLNEVGLLSANWKKCYLEKWLPTCFLLHISPADAGALGLGGLDAVLAIRTCLISPEKMGEDACIVLLDLFAVCNTVLRVWSLCPGVLGYSVENKLS